MSGDKFYPIGSPLDGKIVPLDWKRLDPRAKARALVAAGHAPDYVRAKKLLGKHVAACRKYRQEKEKRKREEGRS